jgi:hypothetical protein
MLRAVLATVLVLAAYACGDNAPAGPLGEPCTSDAECAALHCIAAAGDAPVDLDPLALECGELTGRIDDDAHACDAAQDCARGICLLAGACARSCSKDADCDDDQRCASVFARASDDALQSLDACVALSDLPERAQADSELRPKAIEPGSNELALDVKEREQPTFIVLDHADADWPGVECRPPLCLQSLRTRDDDARTLFDAAADYAELAPPVVPVASGDHISPLVLQLPGRDQAGFSAAGYVAELNAEQAGDLRITRASGPGGQQLDLNLFYVGALGFSPTGDRGPPALADALDVVDEILSQADIYVGDVRQIAVRGALPMRGTYFDRGDAAQGFALLHVRFGSYVELPGLFQLSAGAANSAINLFLLDDIEPLMADREPEAEAGGIPGPPAMHGTSGSGIAVATAMMVADPKSFGRTLAHEIGHYLGLFHVSEADGSVLDNLDDTAECRSAQDSERNGLDRADCEGHGADNLMFWAKTSGTVLSERQRAVLRANPILH